MKNRRYINIIILASMLTAITPNASLAARSKNKKTNKPANTQTNKPANTKNTSTANTQAAKPAESLQENTPETNSQKVITENTRDTKSTGNTQENIPEASSQNVTTENTRNTKNTESAQENTTKNTKPVITKDQQEEIDKAEQEAAQEIDNQIVQATEQMQKIDSLLEELAQIIQNGLVKSTNKAKLILQIKSIRKFISNIVNNPFEQADTSTINFLLSTNKYLIEKIKTSINNGLKSLPEIDIEDLINKSGNSKFASIKDLENKHYQNEYYYNKLEKSVQTVGLSWVNLAYRNFVVAPYKIAEKYQIPTALKWSLFIGAATTYILYRTTDILTPYLGEAPDFYKRPKEQSALDIFLGENKMGFLGKLESRVFSTLRIPMMKYILVAAPFLLKKDFVNMKLWANEKLENLHNKLMGGIQAKSNKGQFNLTNPRFTFKDVVGLDHVKRDLKPLIEFIKNSARFERVGIGPEKGYLFAGKPGTGKSFMAEALAGEIAKELNEMPGNKNNISFINFEASEIFEYVTKYGVSDAIDGIMNYAKQNAPCVVFIDEPDLLGLQRTANKELLSKLLNAMNGFLSNNISENVIILAATNRPDNLDPALLRRGRLGKIIHFEYPTYEARKDYIEKKLNPIVTEISDFDVEKLARETSGCTFEGIQSMIRRAFQETRIKGGSLTQKILESALNEEVRQILLETKNLSEKELQIVAASQAACALTNLLLETPDKLACVTINPVMGEVKESNVWDRYYKNEDKIINQGKIFTYQDSDTSDILCKKDLLNNCRILLADTVGQEILLGNDSHNYNKASSEHAVKIALSIVADGLDTEKMPKKVLSDYYKKAVELVETCKQDVRDLLAKNKENLTKIYKALLAKKTLDVKEIQEIIKK
ncbi:MAG: ATP-dependent zinc metalloprotease FtsH [candidate division TM6 bacterium GW2011_GWF2_30_66]|nr:MAG: ATP-dependent zinc metalloprotease FtsH [candidate division TM6 bacterium GW2011_GWF2_30_66]